MLGPNSKAVVTRIIVALFCFAFALTILDVMRESSNLSSKRKLHNLRALADNPKPQSTNLPGNVTCSNPEGPNDKGIALQDAISASESFCFQKYKTKAKYGYSTTIGPQPPNYQNIMNDDPTYLDKNDTQIVVRMRWGGDDDSPDPSTCHPFEFNDAGLFACQTAFDVLLKRCQRPGKNVTTGSDMAVLFESSLGMDCIEYTVAY